MKRRQTPVPGCAMRMPGMTRFDLNLFAVLAALQECGSVSGAARRAGSAARRRP